MPAYQVQDVQLTELLSRQLLHNPLFLSRPVFNEKLKSWSSKFSGVKKASGSGIQMLQLLQAGLRLPAPYNLLVTDHKMLLPVLHGYAQCAFIDSPIANGASASASSAATAASLTYATSASSHRDRDKNGPPRQTLPQPSTSTASVAVAPSAANHNGPAPNSIINSTTSSRQTPHITQTAPNSIVGGQVPQHLNGPATIAKNTPVNELQQQGVVPAPSAQPVDDQKLVQLVYDVIYECICLPCWAYSPEFRFVLTSTRLPIIERLDRLSKALDSRDESAFQSLIKDYSFLEARRKDLLCAQSSTHGSLLTARTMQLQADGAAASASQQPHPQQINCQPQPQSVVLHPNVRTPLFPPVLTLSPLPIPPIATSVVLVCHTGPSTPSDQPPDSASQNG